MLSVIVLVSVKLEVHLCHPYPTCPEVKKWAKGKKPVAYLTPII